MSDTILNIKCKTKKKDIGKTIGDNTKRFKVIINQHISDCKTGVPICKFVMYTIVVLSILSILYIYVLYIYIYICCMYIYIYIYIYYVYVCECMCLYRLLCGFSCQQRVLKKFFGPEGFSAPRMVQSMAFADKLYYIYDNNNKLIWLFICKCQQILTQQRGI